MPSSSDQMPSLAPFRASTPAAARRRSSGHILLLVPLAAIVLVFFIYPLGEVIGRSLFDPTLTLKHFARVLGDQLYIRVLWSTIKISALTSFLCLLIGYPMAYWMSEASPRVQSALVGVVTLSFLMSLLVKTYSWTVLLQDTGVINSLLRRWGIIETPLPLMYNLFGVLIGMVHMLLPFMILPLYAVFLKMDRSLRLASAGLGASPLRTWWTITLPLSLQGAAAGGFLVFVVALGFFITPALLGGPEQTMLSNLIDNQIRTVLNWPFGSALASVLLAFTVLVYAGYYRFFGSEAVWERT
jgi:putative spermidine/putrescine transport system permease protein